MMVPMLLAALAPDVEVARPLARVEANTIVVEGKSPLPDGSVLTAEIFRWQVRAGDEIARDQTVGVRGGRFKKVFVVSPDKIPPSILWARVAFNHWSQRDFEALQAIRAGGFKEGFEWTQMISVGTDADRKDAFVLACRKFERQVDRVEEILNSFFEHMGKEPELWKGKAEETAAKIQEEIRRDQEDTEYKIYTLDGMSLEFRAFGMAVTKAIRARAAATTPDKAGSADRLADAARGGARFLHNAVSSSGKLRKEVFVKITSIHEMIDDPGGPAKAWPLLLQLDKAVDPLLHPKVVAAGYLLESLVGDQQNADVRRKVHEALVEITRALVDK